MPESGLFELNAVVAVAAHRNFRRAAAELGLSPSALSHAIASLERRLGVRLFHRTTRSVSLSGAGEQFLSRIRPALGEIENAMRDVNALRDTPSGTLRINASEGSARQVLQPVILAFLRRYPDMQLDLVTEGRLIDIVAEGFDAGIRPIESVPQDMIAVPVVPQQRFAVVGSPAYFKKHPQPRVPDDLLKHDCIRYRFGSGRIFRWEFEKRGQEQVIDVRGRFSTNSPSLMIGAALDGFGLAFVNEALLPELLKSRRLIRVLEDWTPPFPGLALYYPGHRHVPAGLRALVGIVRERAGQSPV